MIAYPNDKAELCAVIVPASSCVRVYAYGIKDEDCIKFTKVEFSNGIPDLAKGCALIKGKSPEVVSQGDYMVGGCVVTMHRNRNSVVFPYGGFYIVELGGAVDNIELEIRYEVTTTRDFTNAELGIDPCGCPCIDSTWSWNGEVRCNDLSIEREYESNCGKTEWRFHKAIQWTDTGETRCENHIIEKKQLSDCGAIRWTQTQQKCGYEPSVLFPIPDMCGKKTIGYMFHPNDERDPAATVEIRDCDNKLYGFIYPTPGAGHTIEVSFCSGEIKGYAINKSNVAPEIIDHPDCGCGE